MDAGRHGDPNLALCERRRYLLRVGARSGAVFSREVRRGGSISRTVDRFGWIDMCGGQSQLVTTIEAAEWYRMSQARSSSVSRTSRPWMMLIIVIISIHYMIFIMATISEVTQDHDYHHCHECSRNRWYTSSCIIIILSEEVN